MSQQGNVERDQTVSHGERGRRRRASSPGTADMHKWKVTKPMIEAYGYTPGCRKCDSLQGIAPGVADHAHRHSEECRLRLEKEGLSDPRFSARIQDSEREVKRARGNPEQPGLPGSSGDTEIIRDSAKRDAEQLPDNVHDDPMGQNQQKSRRLCVMGQDER